MKKTMVLWSAIAIQAIMHVVLGSFGIMSLTNMKSGGFVIAAIWLVIFANVFKWVGGEPKYIIKMAVVCTVSWMVIWTLTEMFLVRILFGISEQAGYFFYGLECLICFGSVFLFAAMRTGKKIRKNLFIIVAMMLVVAAYIIATDQVIKNVVDMIPGESFMDMFAGGLRMPRHEMMEKVSAAFYAVESFFLIALFEDKNNK